MIQTGKFEKKKTRTPKKKKPFHLALTHSKRTIMHILNQTSIEIYFAIYSIHTFTPCFLKINKGKVKSANCPRKVIYVQTVPEKLVKGNSCM